MKDGYLGLSDWLTYFFFCGTVMWGMAIEYRDFNNFINLRGDFDVMKKNSAMRPGFVRFLHALLCAATMIVLGLMIDASELLNPEMGLQPIWYRTYYIIMCMH